MSAGWRDAAGRVSAGADADGVKLATSESSQDVVAFPALLTTLSLRASQSVTFTLITMSVTKIAKSATLIELIAHSSGVIVGNDHLGMFGLFFWLRFCLFVLLSLKQDDVHERGTKVYRLSFTVIAVFANCEPWV